MSTRDKRRARLARLQQKVTSLESIESVPDPEVSLRSKRKADSSSSTFSSSSTSGSSSNSLPTTTTSTATTGRDRKRRRPLGTIESSSSSSSALSTVVAASSTHIIDQARKKADIQRNETSIRLQNDLSRQSEKAGHLNKLLRDSVTQNASATAQLSEQEVLHLKEKSNLLEQIRELKKLNRTIEMKQNTNVSIHLNDIKELKLKLATTNGIQENSNNLENQIQVLQLALGEEKKRTLREQDKHKKTLETFEKLNESREEFIGSITKEKENPNNVTSQTLHSQQQLLVKVGDLERQNRSLKRDNAALRTRCNTTIILEERISELEKNELQYNKTNKNNNIILSERNMLRQEKKTWNESFTDVLQRCRSMAGEATIPLELMSSTSSNSNSISSSFSNSSGSSGSSGSSSSNNNDNNELQQCTVPAVLHLLDRLRAREALTLSHQGELERRMNGLERDLEKSKQKELNTLKESSIIENSKNDILEKLNDLESKYTYSSIENESLKKMLKTYQDELDEETIVIKSSNISREGSDDSMEVDLSSDSMTGSGTSQQVSDAQEDEEEDEDEEDEEDEDDTQETDDKDEVQEEEASKNEDEAKKLKLIKDTAYKRGQRHSEKLNRKMMTLMKKKTDKELKTMAEKLQKSIRKISKYDEKLKRITLDLTTKRNEIHELRNHIESNKKREVVLRNSFDSAKNRIQTLQQQSSSSPSILTLTSTKTR